MNQNLYKILFEQEEDKQKTPENPLSITDKSVRTRPAEDSVDDQIDALILRYENASIKDTDQLNESLTKLTLKMLLEQEEEEEVAEEEAEEETAEPAGREDMDVKEPAKEQEIPNLDVDEFTNRVVRLIMNFKNLLNIEEVIVNRVKNFLDENYGDEFVNKYLNNLEQEHGISATEFPKIKYSDDENFAIGANPAGAGMGGGG